jgi:hypothetical protein
MAEIILKFDSLEESEEARTALDGWKWKMAIYDLDQILRGTVRHNMSIIESNRQASDEEIDLADKIREEIREILNKYNLSFED